MTRPDPDILVASVFRVQLSRILISSLTHPKQTKHFNRKVCGEGELIKTCAHTQTLRHTDTDKFLIPSSPGPSIQNLNDSKASPSVSLRSRLHVHCTPSNFLLFIFFGVLAFKPPIVPFLSFKFFQSFAEHRRSTWETLGFLPGSLCPPNRLFPSTFGLRILSTMSAFIRGRFPSPLRVLLSHFRKIFNVLRHIPSRSGFYSVPPSFLLSSPSVPPPRPSPHFFHPFPAHSFLLPLLLSYSLFFLPSVFSLSSFLLFPLAPLASSLDLSSRTGAVITSKFQKTFAPFSRPDSGRRVHPLVRLFCLLCTSPVPHLTLLPRFCFPSLPSLTLSPLLSSKLPRRIEHASILSLHNSC